MGGVARTVYRIQNSGIYELRVTADPAEISQILSLEINESGGQITSFEPTISPTETNTQPVLTPEVTPTPTNPLPLPHESGNPSVADWFFATILIITIATIFYWWGIHRQLSHWNPRIPICSGLSGYLVYGYFLAGLPGARTGVEVGGTITILLWVFAGSLIGGVFGVLLRQRAFSKKH